LSPGPANPVDTAWAVRVRRTGPRESRAYARRFSFDVGEQAGLRDTDPHPSALEYLVGALGGDLIRGFETEAARRGFTVDEIELTLDARLDNPLVLLGVIGEEGSPGLSSIRGKCDVSLAPPPEGSSPVGEAAAEIWRTALSRSPLYTTLSRAARIDIRFRVAP
jgi:hypothetical protein